MPVTAPKCPLCKSVHWQREPHVWTDAEPVEKAPTHRTGAFRKPLEARKSSALSIPSSVSCETCRDLAIEIVTLKSLLDQARGQRDASQAALTQAIDARPAAIAFRQAQLESNAQSNAPLDSNAAGFDKKAYQRDLMRKRRAAKKVGL